jgi:hypothetical protein
VCCSEKHRNATDDLGEEVQVGDFNRSEALGEVSRRVETRISKVDSMA